MALCLVFSCLGMPWSAFGESLSIRVTHSTTLEYRTDNANGESDDDEYGAAIERLNLAATTGRLSTQMRVDGMYFMDPPAAWNQNDARLERISIRYRLAPVTFRPLT